VAWAAALERSARAAKAVTRRAIARRNEAVRAAHDRGVPVNELATRLRLTRSWIRTVIKNPKKAAMEEAA
jgi:Mor family transcriptional regulator